MNVAISVLIVEARIGLADSSEFNVLLGYLVTTAARTEMDEFIFRSNMKAGGIVKTVCVLTYYTYMAFASAMSIMWLNLLFNYEGEALEELEDSFGEHTSRILVVAEALSATSMAVGMLVIGYEVWRMIRDSKQREDPEKIADPHEVTWG